MDNQLKCGLTTDELNDIFLREIYSEMSLTNKLMEYQITNKIIFKIIFPEENIEETATIYDQKEFDKTSYPNSTISFRPIFKKSHVINKDEMNSLLSKIDKNGVLISDLSYNEFFNKYYNNHENATVYEF